MEMVKAHCTTCDDDPRVFGACEDTEVVGLEWLVVAPIPSQASG
jgi:hypothetical protein